MGCHLWLCTGKFLKISVKNFKNFKKKIPENFWKNFWHLFFRNFDKCHYVMMTSLFKHKTPSGAFDPEVFAAPSTHSTSITELPLSSQNMVPGHELHRTESLGLKCLSDKPLLVSQIRNSSKLVRKSFLLQSDTYQNQSKHGFGF